MKTVVHLIMTIAAATTTPGPRITMTGTLASRLDAEDAAGQ